MRVRRSISEKTEETPLLDLVLQALMRFGIGVDIWGFLGFFLRVSRLGLVVSGFRFKADSGILTLSVPCPTRL